MWLIVLVTRTDARLRRVGWRPLVMGLLEPGLVTLVVSLGLTMTSPVNGSVFWSLTPLIMPILGRVVLGGVGRRLTLGWTIARADEAALADFDGAGGAGGCRLTWAGDGC